MIYGLPASAVIFGWIINILITVFMFRIWLQASCVNLYNPVSGLILRLTRKVVDLLPVSIGGRKSVAGISLPSVAAVLILLVIKYAGIYLILDIPGEALIHPLYLCKPLVFILHYTAEVFIFVLIADAILSWFRPNSISEITRSLMGPVYSALNSVIPPIGMINIGGLALLLLLYLADYLIIQLMMKFLGPSFTAFLWTLVI